MIYSFSGYTNLGGLLWSLRVCGISPQALLALRLGVILICLHLYATRSFSLVALNILSLFHVFNVSIVMCHKEFTFWSSLFGILFALIG